MMNHRLIILRGARKQLLSPIAVPRNAFVRPQCRLLSVAKPLLHEQDDQKDWKEKEQKKTLKRMLKKSSSAPAASTAAATNIVPSEIQDNQNSPSELTYTGNATMPITTRLHIVTPDEDTPRGVWPVFRLMVS
jgi:hypothetical protein